LTGLCPGGALDDGGAVVATDPAPETRVGTIKGPQTGFERGIVRNRTFARSTAETDSATPAQIMKRDRVTAGAMERLPQTNAASDLYGPITAQQIEGTPQDDTPEMTGHYRNATNSPNAVR
jgi:hypothetical protein